MVVQWKPVSHLAFLVLEGPALTNGGLNLHSPVKRKLETEKDYVFDKRLRYSVRQNESNCRFRDIVVRKEEGFTHILLSSQTSDNNALTPEVKSFWASFAWPWNTLYSLVHNIYGSMGS